MTEWAGGQVREWRYTATGIWQSLELQAIQIESTQNGKLVAIFDGYYNSDILYSFAFLFIQLDGGYKKGAFDEAL